MAIRDRASVWPGAFAGLDPIFVPYSEADGAKLALPVGESITPPPLWFVDSSDKALAVAAKHVDTYLSRGETPELIKDKVEAVKTRAAHYERNSNMVSVSM